ncbi:MAG TPA: long-chain fatty acid--CoA ligase [Baekduia sp.]|uniref:long-chain fatty acid--CoA ligase n=1 Tax=Baekduia sp. TaxID=2600305 RepID=UPI002D769FFB|nr:long-chain fatty acid--CoA ligase [Baekduia sp.]HET6509121.1 long-chain fatty acid--CoA ligase [Baekduia sp.]
MRSGLMMERPMLVSTIAERAERVFGAREVVGRTALGIERSTYAEVVRRARRLADALSRMRVGPGDRVATFGWNSLRHLELYLAVPSMGAVLHTLNIRLSEDDLKYIVEHAGDRVIFLDASLAASLPRFDGVEHEVLMPDDEAVRAGAMPYEDLVAGGDPGFAFPELDESAAAAMCYTSGTTGRPKGVVYSHRSIALYSLMANQPDAFGIHERDSVMPVVPMFHANAWGLPFISAMAGARQVMPGPSPTPAIIADLMRSEDVTVSAAVPTVWQGLADLDPRPDLSSVRELICGGAAVPEQLIRTFDERFDVPVVQGWGMTETSPLAAISRLPVDAPEAADERYALRAKQGRVLSFISARLDAENGGELQVRGPSVARAYYGGEGEGSFTDDGWLRTGDVAEIDDRAFVKLVDRTKDLVKSGGEWISSVELETAVLFHPGVLEAAVVAMPDSKWGERPCMFVVAREGARLDGAELRSFLGERFPSWWLPDRFELVAELPKTSVGKLDKKVLRRRLLGDGDGQSRSSVSAT